MLLSPLARKVMGGIRGGAVTKEALSTSLDVPLDRVQTAIEELQMRLLVTTDASGELALSGEGGGDLPPGYPSTSPSFDL